MKPVVTRSIGDPGGDRCIDIRRLPDGTFDRRDCRRDPEHPHGRRLTGVGATGFGSGANALEDAAATVGRVQME